MKIGFVVNSVKSEKAEFTTTRLARRAVEMGHSCWLIGVGDFIYSGDESIRAWAHQAPEGEFSSLDEFLPVVQSEDSRARITVDELDVLLLRYDPAEEKRERPWAQTAGILFGELAAARGVIVLNDPQTLANALNKTYFQHFPEIVRPRTCISRNVDEIKSFITDQHDRVVIKPLQGSGGESVFLIRETDTANLHQMIEAVIRDGYCIAQEYLPAAEQGDVRLFVMNGQPLIQDGKYAVFRRVSGNGDLRNNMHSGGGAKTVEVTDAMLSLVDALRPKLVRDGMFLVGLDVVADKLMEINVFTPGGLGSASLLGKTDFTVPVIQALERKVHYRNAYGARLSNRELATL